MEFVKKLYESIYTNANQNAFYIKDTFYTYKVFSDIINSIRFALQQNVSENEKMLGLVTNNDIETYAAIIALWFEGKAYVPVNPEVPQKRNEQVFELTDIHYVIDSSEVSTFNDLEVINPQKIESVTQKIPLKKVNNNDLAYILFTSGTTGLPKGVPITFNNVNALVNAVDIEPDFNLMPTDRCLQMFELTFDFSVVTYLFPILSGACIYTIPKGAIKYFYIFKLINEQRLTVLTMVPSIINYLRPYFNEINAPDVRYCSFGGGALHADIAQEWSDCLPNCKVFNYYGPTEYTVYSGFYPYNKETHTKNHNGVVAIGKPQVGTTYIVVDENNKEVQVGITGELCLGGEQVTPGYWKNPQKNEESFFVKEEKGEMIRFYKTGDLCFKDNQGDFLYVGRSDFQVKIRGYRVELAEIEFHAKAACEKKVNIVALDILNQLGNSELGLAIESDEFDTTSIFEYMKSKMPDYMIPSHTRFIKEFPHSINGKINRKELKSYFEINK
ncbi:AMP-binding protein [Aquimarina agarilytica]|uniref:AMP-binding protein n=1 Tax=Aquimarina agarilytica TaxID=1087449 RepID=UPI000288C9A0|nr:AMP-binding protein [Aquimarina agarilytica]